MQGMKETAANVGASAKAGMEKTKATMQEKVDKMSAHDPMQKEMATQKKEQKKAQAEFDKQEAREHNAAAKQAARAGAVPQYTTGATGIIAGTQSATGTHQGSALPGQATGQPLVEEGMGRTRPTDTAGHNVPGGTYT